MAVVDDNIFPLRVRRDLSTTASRSRCNGWHASTPSTPTRPVFEDRRWSAAKGIIFAGAAPSTRAYAVRTMPGRKPPAPQQTPARNDGGIGTGQPNSPDGQPRKPSPSRPSRSVFDVNEKLEQEQADHKITRQALKEMEHQLKKEQAAKTAEKEKLETQSHVHQQEIEELGRVHSAEQEAKLQEQQRSFDAKFKTVYDETYKRAENDIREKQAAMTAETERRLKSAKQLENERSSELKEQRRLEKQAEDYLRKLKYDNAEHLTRERSNHQKRAQQEHKDESDRLEEEVAQRLEAELDRLRRPGVNRQIERKDYESYRSVWRKLDADFGKLSDGMQPIEDLVGKRAILWSETERNFDPEKIEPWLPQRYPALVKSLRSMLHGKLQAARQSEDQLKVLRQRLDQMGADVRSSSHFSRALTRFHHFEEDYLAIKSLSLHSELLNERPLREERDRIDRKLQEIDGELASSPSAAKRELLEQRQDDLERYRSMVVAIIFYFAALRDADSLRVLSQSPPKIQELYLRLLPIREAIMKADRTWSDYNRGRQGRDEKNRKDREDFLGARTRMKEKLRQLEMSIRKRQLLEDILGEQMSESDRSGFAKTIADRLSKAEAKADLRLHEMVKIRLQPRQRRRLGTPSRSPVVPIRTIKSGGERPDSPAQTEREFQSRRRKLKRKFSSATSSTEKQQLEAQLAALKREVTAWQQRRQEANRVGVKASKTTKKASQEVKQTQPSQAHESGDVSTASASAAAVEQEAKSAQLRSKTHAQRRRKEQSRAKRSGNNPAKVQSASNSQDSNSKGGSAQGLNIKPTAAKQAPLQYRSAFITDDQSEYSQEDLSMAIWNSSLQHDAFAGSSLYASKGLSEPKSAESSFAKCSAMDSGSRNPASLGLDNEDAQSQEQQPLSNTQSSSSSYQPSEQTDSSIASQPAQNSQSEHVMAVASDDLPQLSHQMSTADYRTAVMASPSNAGAYWTHKLYKNSEGKPPLVYYCTNFETAELRAKEFAAEPVIGFDIEWEVRHTPGKSGIKKNVSLIQIAADDKIALFHVAVFKGETIEELMPPSLREILESREVVKAGVNIQGDAWRLDECLNVKMTGLFELSHLYRVVMFSDSPDQINRKPFKLADQVQNVLLLPLKKDAVRTSAWSRKLDFQQSEYAAADAYAGFRLYHALEAKRRMMDPMPPRPAFWEEHKPIQLGDGTLIQAKTRKKAAAAEGKRTTEEDDEEDEEFFDAVESMDAYDLEGKLAGVPLAGLSISYPTLPSFEEQLSESLGKVRIDNSGPSGKAITKKSGPPPSSAITEAEEWVSTYRSSRPVEYVVRATHAQLRAYALWHHQRLECREVAALLRETPLQLQTVATYVLEAVRQEGLEVEGQRMSSVVEILPASVRGRYGRVLDRAGVE